MLKTALLAIALALPIAASSFEPVQTSAGLPQSAPTSQAGPNYCWVYFMGSWWFIPC